MPTKMPTKNASGQNRTLPNFVFLVFCVFLCFLGNLAFSTLFLLSKHKQKQAF